MSTTSNQQMLILNMDEHGNQTLTLDDNINTDRLHLDSESSVDNGVDGLSNYVLGRRIKMEADDEVTTVFVQGGDEDVSENYLQADLNVNGLVLEPAEEITAQDTTMDVIQTSESCGVDDDGLIMQHMDIREPLSTLRHLLEKRLNMSLSGYEFWLQDTQNLESHKNLVDQCVQGEGTVQVNVQIKADEHGNKKINIVDVLKPAEEYVEIKQPDDEGDIQFQQEITDEECPDRQAVVRWVVDSNFKRNQIRLNIPDDPNDWDIPHVRHWLLWAVRQFNLIGLKLADWKITGAELCNLSLEDFRRKVPHDPGDLFWTHLELLRKCKFVAVIQNQPENKLELVPSEEDEGNFQKYHPRIRSTLGRHSRVSKAKLILVDANGVSGNRNGNNGQIQLWQFLLELLTDKMHRHAIQWLGSEGEFKLVNPEVVAKLWGLRKNKPTMNYEKLSRALRYYYDGDMISKVHGKRFVYKFVCDLKQLLGYSASELNKLVIEAETKALCNPNLLQENLFEGRDYITGPL